MMERILALGPLLSVALLMVACVPAALRLQLPEAHPRAAAHRAAAARMARMARVATPLAAAGLLLPPGRIAGCLAVPYGVLCAAIAAQALRRLLAMATWSMPAVTLVAAQGTLAGAALWTLAACAGVPLLGYPPVWVGLTAAHFHATGFVLPTVAALVARRRPGPLLTAIQAGIVLGTPLTAAGIYTSLWVERLAGMLLVGTTLALAGVLALEARRLVSWRRWSMGIAVASLALSMPLALLHVLRLYPWLPTARAWDPLSGMVLTHGLLNTLGFSVCALAALRGDAAQHPEAPEGRPHSRLLSGWRVGAHYFARRGLEQPRAAHGLVDSLEALHPQGDRVHLAIRDFYERTDQHALTVRPRWALPLVGTLWSWAGRRMEQLHLPVRESHAETVHSRIVAVDSEADGRQAVRAWIRTRADGIAMYVAAYSVHRLAEQAYMNIAFPLPGGNLASLLHLRLDSADGTAVSLSTLPTGPRCDAGIFWVLGRAALCLRLPMNETIAVWSAGSPHAPAELAAWAGTEASATARHDVWLLGARLFSLDYAILPHPSFSPHASPATNQKEPRSP